MSCFLTLFFLETQAQKTIESINGAGRNFVVIKNNDQVIDTIEVYVVTSVIASELRVVDYLFLSENRVAYIVDFGGIFSYAKHYINDQYLWRPEVVYHIGNYSALSSQPEDYDKVKYTLLAEDDIVKTIDDEEVKINLVLLEKMGFSSRPK